MCRAKLTLPGSVVVFQNVGEYQLSILRKSLAFSRCDRLMHIVFLHVFTRSASGSNVKISLMPSPPRPHVEKAVWELFLALAHDLCSIQIAEFRLSRKYHVAHVQIHVTITHD